jgi:hypothetical protein
MTSSITYSNGTENLTAVPDKEGTYDYEIVTPMKAILSAALVVGKVGLISVDYEIVDYSTAKIKNGSDGYNYFKENTGISQAYTTTGNLHVGGELRVSKSFSLRAGYENFPSVYKDSYNGVYSPNKNLSYSTLAGGFGFRQGNVFFDATYKRIMNSESLKFYPDINATEMTKYASTQNTAIFTLGFKF